MRSTGFKQLAGGLDIARDLGLQRLQRVKFSFVPKAFDETQLQFGAVQLSLEIEQVSLNAPDRYRVHRRQKPNVHRRAITSPGDMRMSRIHAVGRQHQTGSVDVRRRKPEFLSRRIAMHHFPGERVASSEHLAGRVELAAANRFANARATHHFSIQRYRGEAVHDEVQLLTQRAQQADVATPPVTKCKCASYANAVNVAKVACEPAHEFLPGLSAERFVEPNDQCHVGAERLKRAQFLRKGIDQFRLPFRRYHRIWVPIECNHHGQCFLLFGVGYSLPNHLLMAEVHSIKDPDGSADFSTKSLQLA